MSVERRQDQSIVNKPIEIFPGEGSQLPKFKRTKRMLEVEEQFGKPIDGVLHLLHWREEKSLTEMKSELGLKTYETVAIWMHKVGVDIRPRSEGVRLMWSDPNKKKEIIDSWHTPEANANRVRALGYDPKIDVPQGTQRKSLQVKKAFGIETDEQFKQILEALYRQEGSQKKVAKRIGRRNIQVSQASIGRWIQKLGIKMQVGERYSRMEERRKFVKKAFSDINLLLQAIVTLREEYVLRERYLREGKQRTLEDIGRELGCDRRAVHCSEQNALRKLRIAYREIAQADATMLA